MQASSVSTASYAKVIANSKRVRWDIEDDVLRGRRFDLSKPFLPRGLSLAGEVPFLPEGDRRLFSQVQGRSYAFIFGLVERFISAKMLEIGHAHSLGDQVALEALVGTQGDFSVVEREMVAATFLKAYRWQYIVSGVMEPRFQEVLFGTLSPAQVERVNGALAPLLLAAPAEPSRIVEPA